MVPTAQERQLIVSSAKSWAALAGLSIGIGSVLGARAGCSERSLVYAGLVVLLFATSGFVGARTAMILVLNRRMSGGLMGLSLGFLSHFPVTLIGLALFGVEYLQMLRTRFCGLSRAVGLLFACGLIWGAVLAHRRRKLPERT
jgi:hypothetical protein